MYVVSFPPHQIVGLPSSQPQTLRELTCVKDRTVWRVSVCPMGEKDHGRGLVSVNVFTANVVRLN